ncbi:MAG: hypothetical protein ACP5RF_03370 [Candidatus Micrarchaeia archaeon]
MGIFKSIPIERLIMRVNPELHDLEALKQIDECRAIAEEMNKKGIADELFSKEELYLLGVPRYEEVVVGSKKMWRPVLLDLEEQESKELWPIIFDKIEKLKSGKHIK